MHPSFSTRGILALAGAAMLAAGAACGGDGGTPPPAPVITTLDKQTSTDGQTATVASALPLAPSVVVLDQNGNPMAGVTVTFTVTAGGGSVTGATPETDEDGIATVGSWTLGTAVGANTLRASASGKLATFEATGIAAAASVIQRVSGTDGQNATAGNAVALAPAVRVTDAYDNPIADVDVTFALVAGGGELTGATQVTNDAGIATVGSWTLGTAAGLNEISATADGLDPVTFTATGTAGAAATIEKDAMTDETSATVGTAVSSAPSVIVKDANGNPVAGATVTFAVVSGGGSITGETQTTSATGVATVGTWTLGTAAGANTLSATLDGLDALTFTATGTAGAATALTIVDETDQQYGNAEEALALPPSVIVGDQYGNPVSGVTVTFEVTAGGGSITGATQESGADGVAAVGSWTLGPYNEVNELTAGATGLETVTFQAAPEPCSVNPPLTVGQPFAGVLDQYDCAWASSGTNVDFYRLALPAAQALDFTMTSAAFDAFLQLFDADGLNRAHNDNGAGGTDARFRVLLPAGSYEPAATATAAGMTGDYTISAAAASATITGCARLWVVRGISTSQSLATTDCVNSAGPWYSDEVLIYLHAGESVTFTMTSSAVNAHLVIYDANGTYITEDDNSAGGTNARLTYTATAAGTYIVKMGAYTAQTGAYTLEVQ